jgi:adenine-specific DNA methylase
MIPKKTILESTNPPVILASDLALREGNSKKPIYTMHKWWARRLGSVFRLLFLGATNPPHRSAWLQNGAFFEKHDLTGLKVFDPFVGGGTTLVEAAKCGASVIGNDIDPVAAFVTEKELQPINEKRLQTAFATVEAAVKDACLKWYRTTLPDGRTGAIIYAFWVEEISSPETGQKVFAHPHYQLHRDQKNKRQTVFCSFCHAIRILPIRRANFVCAECGQRTTIRQGVVRDGRITAPGFNRGQKLIKLYSDKNPPSYHLFALQVLIDGTDQKVFKKADAADILLFQQAEAQWQAIAAADEIVPTESIPTIHRTDRRPLSYGLSKYRQLFNARQLLCLATIGKAIKAVTTPTCRQFLALAFSDCLASNNMFCFYAFDYDKLTPLFGLHAYSKVTRPVENNVWGVDMGRGTFAKCFAKMIRGKQYGAKPYENKYEPNRYHPRRIHTGEAINSRILSRNEPVDTARHTSSSALILNQSSANLPIIPSGSVHLVLTDPPYYNNLAYSELSDFYHVWLKRLDLPKYNTANHAPMAESLYGGKNSSSPAEQLTAFADGLASVFAECRRVLAPGGMMVFSYSHNQLQAWAALAYALAKANFAVTAVFPVRSEGQSQFHSDVGNLKWDAVFCCRKARRKPKHARRQRTLDHLEADLSDVRNWQKALKSSGLDFSGADARSLAFALQAKELCNRMPPHGDIQEFEPWKSAAQVLFLRTGKCTRDYEQSPKQTKKAKRRRTC